MTSAEVEEGSVVSKVAELAIAVYDKNNDHDLSKAEFSSLIKIIDKATKKAYQDAIAAMREVGNEEEAQE